jgi:hypothetical protein
MIKNRLIIFFIFTLSLILVFSYGEIVSYTLLCFTIFVPLFSIIYTIFVYFRFKVIQNIDKKFVVKGDSIKYNCEICNEDFILYPYIKAKFFSISNVFNQNIEDRYFSLMPNEKLSFSTELDCKFRGDFEIGIQYIEIEDFLGIFKIRYTPINYLSIKVSPRIVKLRRINFNSNYSSDSDTTFGINANESSIFSDVRKYVYGDSFRKIHWKYTAKYKELMSKNFQPSSDTNITVIIDIKKFGNNLYENLVLEDILIESVISLINYCLSNSLKINLLLYNGELIEIKCKNSQDFDNIYSIIDNINFIDDFNIDTVIDLYLKMNNNKSNVFLFSFNINYSLFDSVYEFILSGFPLSLVYVRYLNEIFDNSKSEIIKNLSQLGMKKYEIKSCDEISSVFELTN